MKNIIELDADTKERLVKTLQMYFHEELETTIGSFQAQFFLDFILEELAPYFYNQAINDTHAWLTEKFLYLADDIYLLSKEEKY